MGSTGRTDVLLQGPAVEPGEPSGQRHARAEGEVFFTRARTVVENAPDKDAALAYALGFVCHFALDSTCHPYVEPMSGRAVWATARSRRSLTTP